MYEIYWWKSVETFSFMDTCNSVGFVSLKYKVSFLTAPPKSSKRQLVSRDFLERDYAFSLCSSSGGTKSWILKHQVNFNVTPIYKDWGKRIFEFGVRLNPPHWPSNFENHHYRVKNQSCRKLYRWVSKPIRRKIQNQWKKLELNRAHQLREKSKKPPENTFFKKSEILGGFLDFSLNW